MYLVGEEALWLDHREERYCRLSGARQLVPWLPGLPLTAGPAVLLGRLPAPPAGAPPPPGGRFEYRDAEARRWSVRVGPEGVGSWTLWEGGEPVTWWSRHGGEAVLSDRRHGVQVRWREVLREPAPELPPPAVPEGYRADCDAAQRR